MTLSLPLADPAVRGYLFYAYPLSILAGHGDAHLPWLYSTFVQLYQLPGADLKFYLHPFSPGSCLRHVAFATCPWLDVQSVDQRLVSRGVPLSVFLRHALGQGLYPQVDVDYGWLPDRPRAPFLHEVLVRGCDESRRLFEISGYDDRGRFRPSRISFDELEAAALAAGRLAASPRAEGDLSWGEPELAERPRLFLYRYVADAAFAFDVEAVRQQLWDYVESADSSCRYRAVVAPVTARWGMDVYQGLVERLGELRAWVETPAPAAGVEIPLRLLWEHKRLLAARVAFMVDGGLLAPDPVRHRRLQALVADAFRLRLVMLRWRRDPAGGALDTAVDALRSLAARELDLLGRLLDLLDAPRRSHHPRTTLPAAA